MEDKEIIKKLVKNIHKYVNKEIRIMEVCGTHTQCIARYGIPDLLPKEIKLLSGPGCPVCVTDEYYIDTAISLLKRKEVLLATFGDIVKVRGTSENLLEQTTKGGRIKIIYSPMEVLSLAEKNKDKNIVFLAIGFETTAPLIALVLKNAQKKGIKNLFVLTSLKRIAPALHEILSIQKARIDGIICPGNVAVIVGEEYFDFIYKKYKVPAVITGFEPLDILGGIYFLIKAITNNSPIKYFNLYKRFVKEKGNITAINLMNEFFKIEDSFWRGIGLIKNSSLILNEKYKSFDVLNKYQIKLNKNPTDINLNCKCKEILMGLKTPDECSLFKKICNPLNPQGPCMISSEGACAAYYKYQGGLK